MIKLSKKWSYSIKAIIFIAENYPKILQIKDIAQSLKISESLLRRIIAELDKSGILITTKWRDWGVQIAMDFKDISLYDILNSVWEELGISKCTKWIFCENSDNCNTTNLFSNLQKSFNWILKLQTLDKILKKSI